MKTCSSRGSTTGCLNLTNDIITGKTDVEGARKTYAKIAMAFKKGDKHPYTQKLNFPPIQQARTQDPDKEVKA